MTDPRIGAFARLASGDSEPVRIVSGQNTKLTRVAHGITYDAGRDEIFASEPLASSVVAFRGGASGEAAPLAVIQGPKTRLHQPWGLQVDDLHKELVVADFATSSILTYAWDANGDVAPKRVIRGPETGMRGLSGLAVDPERNLIVGATFLGGKRGSRAAGPYSNSFGWGGGNGGLFIFDRTAQGNVAPRGVIAGPHTGIIAAAQVVVYGGKIFATIDNTKYMPPYDLGGYLPRQGCKGPPLPPLTMGSADNFVGVWNITDNGDVPPMAIIHGPATQLVAPAGIAINPKAGELYITDGGVNGAFTFLVPQFFSLAAK